MPIMEELDAIHSARFVLNDALELDSQDNALFSEDNGQTINGSLIIDLYLSSEEVPDGSDPYGVEYFENRVFFKAFNLNGYRGLGPKSNDDCIHKYAPLKYFHLARGVYTINR